MKLSALLPALFAAASLHASELDFTLVNQTGHDIDALYLSASKDGDWNENLLPDGTVIKAGRRALVKFTAKPADAEWDLRAVKSDGTADTFAKVNLLDVKLVTLVVEDGKPGAVVE